MAEEEHKSAGPDTTRAQARTMTAVCLWSSFVVLSRCSNFVPIVEGGQLQLAERPITDMGSRQ